MEDLDVKIGLETHLQIFTKTKLFCGCPTQGSEKPNTRVCPTCLGMPGSKPRVNKKVIDLSIRIASALNCDINREIFFSRKSYFYPDMSKNFQITQYEIPLAKNGYLDLNGKKKIRIRRINIEEDPAKIIHVGGNVTKSKYILIDYNRSGLPLCEIVTDPDFRTPKEARIFLQKLSTIFEYLQVYDTKAESVLKSDVNISIMGGNRVEIKNVSGFREVERALKYEILRQKNVLKRGRKIELETRAWDPESGVTRSLRTKEEESEYGYIFEPDLTRIEISKNWLSSATRNMPELPDQKRKRYILEFGIGKEVANSIVLDFELTKLFEFLIKDIDPTYASYIISGPLKKTLNYNSIRLSQAKITTNNIRKLIEMLKQDKITERNAELIIRELVLKSGDPEKIAKKMGMEKIKKEYVEKAVLKVIKNNLKPVEDYKSGKKEAFHYLVGQVMKETKGSSDPQEVRKLLKKRLQ